MPVGEFRGGRRDRVERQDEECFGGLREAVLERDG